MLLLPIFLTIFKEKEVFAQKNTFVGQAPVVENAITETKNYEDDNGDCESNDEITIEKTVLKFDSEEYKIPKREK